MNYEEFLLLLDVIKRFDMNGENEFLRKVSLSLFIDDDEATNLREFCSDYLLEVGFDENYDANAKGQTLEKLIDKLFVE